MFGDNINMWLGKYNDFYGFNQANLFDNNYYKKDQAITSVEELINNTNKTLLEFKNDFLFLEDLFKKLSQLTNTQKDYLENIQIINLLKNLNIIKYCFLQELKKIKQVLNEYSQNEVLNLINNIDDLSNNFTIKLEQIENFLTFIGAKGTKLDLINIDHITKKFIFAKIKENENIIISLKNEINEIQNNIIILLNEFLNKKYLELINLKGIISETEQSINQLNYDKTKLIKQKNQQYPCLVCEGVGYIHSQKCEYCYGTGQFGYAYNLIGKTKDHISLNVLDIIITQELNL